MKNITKTLLITVFVISNILGIFPPMRIHEVGAQVATPKLKVQVAYGINCDQYVSSVIDVVPGAGWSSWVNPTSGTSISCIKFEQVGDWLNYSQDFQFGVQVGIAYNPNDNFYKLDCNATNTAYNIGHPKYTRWASEGVEDGQSYSFDMRDPQNPTRGIINSSQMSSYAASGQYYGGGATYASCLRFTINTRAYTGTPKKYNKVFFCVEGYGKYSWNTYGDIFCHTKPGDAQMHKYGGEYGSPNPDTNISGENTKLAPWAYAYYNDNNQFGNIVDKPTDYLTNYQVGLFTWSAPQTPAPTSGFTLACRIGQGNFDKDNFWTPSADYYQATAPFKTHVDLFADRTGGFSSPLTVTSVSSPASTVTATGGTMSTPASVQASTSYMESEVTVPNGAVATYTLTYTVSGGGVSKTCSVPFKTYKSQFITPTPTLYQYNLSQYSYNLLPFYLDCQGRSDLTANLQVSSTGFGGVPSGNPQFYTPYPDGNGGYQKDANGDYVWGRIFWAGFVIFGQFVDANNNKSNSPTIKCGETVNLQFTSRVTSPLLMKFCAEIADPLYPAYFEKYTSCNQVFIDNTPYVAPALTVKAVPASISSGSTTKVTYTSTNVQKNSCELWRWDETGTNYIVLPSVGDNGNYVDTPPTNFTTANKKYLYEFHCNDMLGYDYFVSDNVVVQPDTSTAASVSLTCDISGSATCSIPKNYASSVRFSWSSKNTATGCRVRYSLINGTGSWSTTTPTTYTLALARTGYIVSQVSKTQTTWVQVQCKDSTGAVVNSNASQVNIFDGYVKAQDPTTNLYSTGPVNIPYNTQGNLQWHADNATSCFVNPVAAMGVDSPSGGYKTSNLTAASSIYDLYCKMANNTDQTDYKLGSVEIRVNAPNISGDPTYNPVSVATSNSTCGKVSLSFSNPTATAYTPTNFEVYRNETAFSDPFTTLVDTQPYVAGTNPYTLTYLQGTNTSDPKTVVPGKKYYYAARAHYVINGADFYSNYTTAFTSAEVQQCTVTLSGTDKDIIEADGKPLTQNGTPLKDSSGDKLACNSQSDGTSQSGSYFGDGTVLTFRVCAFNGGGSPTSSPVVITDSSTNLTGFKDFSAGSCTGHVVGTPGATGFTYQIDTPASLTSNQFCLVTYKATLKNMTGSGASPCYSVANTATVTSGALSSSANIKVKNSSGTLIDRLACTGKALIKKYEIAP